MKTNVKTPFKNKILKSNHTQPAPIFIDECKNLLIELKRLLMNTNFT